MIHSYNIAVVVAPAVVVAVVAVVAVLVHIPTSPSPSCAPGMVSLPQKFTKWAAPPMEAVSIEETPGRSTTEVVEDPQPKHVQNINGY